MDLCQSAFEQPSLGDHVCTTMAYKGHAANIKETTQIKKKTRKQKGKHANKKENRQIKKKTRKQKRNHANKKENTQIKYSCCALLS